MDGLKMTRLFLALALSMTVASQPLETIATSGGASLSTQLLNWAQVGFEAFLEWAKKGFGLSTDEENTTSEHIFTIFCCRNWKVFIISLISLHLKIQNLCQSGFK